VGACKVLIFLGDFKTSERTRNSLKYKVLHFKSDSKSTFSLAYPVGIPSEWCAASEIHAGGFAAARFRQMSSNPHDSIGFGGTA
jgi:hypothetical protein